MEYEHILRCWGAYEVRHSQLVHLVLARAAGDLGSAMRYGAASAVKVLAPRLLAELLRALAHLHDECSIVHADVKPSNCLLTTHGALQLCDLGGAARIDGNRGGRTTLVGSPAYEKGQRCVDENMTPLVPPESMIAARTAPPRSTTLLTVPLWQAVRVAQSSDEDIAKSIAP